jgi:hypothetical protein
MRHDALIVSCAVALVGIDRPIGTQQWLVEVNQCIEQVDPK